MIVHQLIELLKEQPRDALVVINGEAVNGIELQLGKVKPGYYNPEFRKNSKGKTKAVVFTKLSELSTGEVVTVCI